MMQQLGLGDPLGWFDWASAGGLILCVVYQGVKHFQADRLTSVKSEFATDQTNDRVMLIEDGGGKDGKNESSTDEDGMQMMALDDSVTGHGDNDDEDEADGNGKSSSSSSGYSNKKSNGSNGTDSATNKSSVIIHETVLPARAVYACGLDKERFYILFVGVTILVIGSPLLSFLAGPTGQAYVLATVATAAKTFAWWINQYPQLKHLSFLQKWIAGWSIAACIEYFPLIGAMTIASENNVHLGLMTAYMEALDNFFRILQQRLLNKPLASYDYIAAAGMFVCVIFQGVMRWLHDHDKL